MQTTLGIDLASQPANTALCVIAWESGRAEVRAVARSAWHGRPIDDEMLSTAIQGTCEIDGGWGEGGRPVKVGIDAPFGWPEPFVEAVSAHHGLQPWPERLGASRAPFERRETDRFVHERIGKLPLSVSTDRIAYPAMRCAVILGDLATRLAPGAVARDGAGLVAEVYPDGALRQWLPDLWAATRLDSYKGRSELAGRRRRQILQALRQGLGPGFHLAPEHAETCITTDDGLDALVCALVARSIERGRTIVPDGPERRRLALCEGWIHLPHAGSLASLV